MREKEREERGRNKDGLTEGKPWRGRRDGRVEERDGGETAETAEEARNGGETAEQEREAHAGLTQLNLPNIIMTHTHTHTHILNCHKQRLFRFNGASFKLPLPQYLYSMCFSLRFALSDSSPGLF